MMYCNICLVTFLAIVSCHIGRTKCIASYSKYFHRTLKNATVYASFGIQKIFECEIICSDHGVKCKGANFYYYGPRNYICELLENVPSEILPDEHLRYKQHSKFIVKTGMYACIIH